MRIAVLCDGGGLARLGLELAGHECTGFELDPWKHRLSERLGSGNCVLADIRDVPIADFDAVWASPPCQYRSKAGSVYAGKGPYDNPYLLDWCLAVDVRMFQAVWIENVAAWRAEDNAWGTLYNAAQFGKKALQNRNRVIGGKYIPPTDIRPYQRYVRGICPAITATEYKGGPNDGRRASKWYGRRLTIQECAYHMGLSVPQSWYEVPKGVRAIDWRHNIYEAIGNGVPVYMAYAFGAMYR